MSALGKATGDGALRLSVDSVHFETGLISKANSLDMETQMAEASPSGNEVPGPGFRTQKHKNEVESRKDSFPAARQVCFQASCKWHYYSQ